MIFESANAVYNQDSFESKQNISSTSARLRGLNPTVHLVPVDNIPPIIKIVGSTVLISQIISVFPNIVAEDGIVARTNWIVLIWRGNDLELSLLIANEPHPTTAEAIAPCFVKLSTEVFKAAKGLINRLSNGSGWLSTSVRTHNLPKDGVIEMSSSVIANGLANIFWHLVEVA